MRQADRDMNQYIANIEYLQPAGSALTICVIVRLDGYTVIGLSAPRDRGAFDAERGKEMSLRRAMERMRGAIGRDRYLAAVTADDGDAPGPLPSFIQGEA